MILANLQQFFVGEFSSKSALEAFSNLSGLFIAHRKFFIISRYWGSPFAP